MDTTNESGRDEQTTEDTAGHALKTDRAIGFDLLGTKRLQLQPAKREVREIPPGAIDGRRRIAG